MRRRLFRLLLIVGFFAAVVLAVIWLSDGPPPKKEFSPAREGAALPCEVPIAWRVTEVDSRFEVSGAQVDRGTVEEAVERAAALWERAAGRSLFRRDPSDGVPVRLVFTSRQAQLQDVLRESGWIDSSRAALEDSFAALQQTADRISSRQRDLNEQVRQLNARVEQINARRRVPEWRRRELRQTKRNLEDEQERLTVRRRAFEERQRRLEEAQNKLQREIEEFNRKEETRGTQRAGRYSEEVETRDGRILSVEDRTISVYQFADLNDLTRVIAHEFGHALGLGHVSDPAAVMTATQIVGEAETGPPRLGSADRELFRKECPSLVED